MLTFNVRSLLSLERRMAISNAIATLKYDLLCLTETWLTPHVPNTALFLPNYSIYRNDRDPDMFTSKHGVVLIGILNSIEHEQVKLSIVHDDYVAIKIYTKPKPILICCVYNPPTGSPFLWSSAQLSNLLYEIELTRSNQICENLIPMGDINFSKTDWESMSSSDDYGNAFIEKLLELNFSNIAKRQLDEVLVNTLDPIISCGLDNNLFSKYSTNQKPCSDHIPICTYLSTFIHPHASAGDVKFAFKRANWEHLNEQIMKSPFDPYCCSNVNVLVQEWYEWINKILEANIPKITRHRSSLPPWVTPSTSHLIKKLETRRNDGR